jgi:hypothetical protein
LESCREKPIETPVVILPDEHLGVEEKADSIPVQTGEPAQVQKGLIDRSALEPLWSLGPALDPDIVRALFLGVVRQKRALETLG